MSTYYRPTEPISLEAIEDSDYLADVGFNFVYSNQHKYFTCEGSCIHYALNDDMEVIDLFRYGSNNPMKILNHLRYEFEVDFVSEHDEEYDRSFLSFFLVQMYLLTFQNIRYHLLF